MDTFNFLGNKTNRGSGDHHNIGSPGLNHGNNPMLYAKTNRCGDKSPPIAKIPSSFANSGGGNKSSSVNRNTGIFSFDKSESADGGRQTADDGRRTADGGRQTADDSKRVSFKIRLFKN